MGLTSDTVEESLLGDKGTTIWLLNPSYGVHSVSTNYDSAADGTSSDVCVIKIQLQRNYIVYLVKYAAIRTPSRALVSCDVGCGLVAYRPTGSVYTCPHAAVCRFMFMTVIVVMGSILTAQSLDLDDHVGDRCAVLFIAFLILVTSMQTDMGLGELTDLLWIDCVPPRLECASSPCWCLSGVYSAPPCRVQFDAAHYGAGVHGIDD
eukprot:5188766-Prymnesium_polylepis.2